MKTYTEEEVKLLLAAQRRICGGTYFDNEQEFNASEIHELICNAPEPHLAFHGTPVRMVQDLAKNTFKKNPLLVSDINYPEWFKKLKDVQPYARPFLNEIIIQMDAPKDINQSLNEGIQIEPVLNEKGEFVGQLIDYKK